MGILENVRATHEARMAAKKPTEKRVLAGVPFQPWNSWPDGGTFATGGLAQPSKAGYGGPNVEGSLANTALYGAVRILAANAASLPINTYVKQGKQNVPDTLPSIFDSSPGSSGSLNNWVFEALSSLILTGNAVGLITGKDGFGNPTGIDWIPTDRVQAEPDGDQPWNVSRTKLYVYGRQVEWRGADREVVLVKSFPLSGHLLGLSMIKAAALTLMQGRLTTEFAANFFTQGGQSHTVMQNNQLTVDPEQSAEIRRMLQKTMRAGEPVVIGADWDVTNLAIKAEEAQFIQTMRLNATHIAAMLGLAPEMIGGDKGPMTYSSSLQWQESVRDALRPWLDVMESAFSDFLPVKRVVKFDDRALLRLDAASQVNVWAAERAAGLKTLNQIHQEMDLPPVDGPLGDEVMGNELLAAMLRGAKVVPKALENSVVAVAQPAPPAPGPDPTVPNPEAPTTPDNTNGDDK